MSAFKVAGQVELIVSTLGCFQAPWTTAKIQGTEVFILDQSALRTQTISSLTASLWQLSVPDIGRCLSTYTHTLTQTFNTFNHSHENMITRTCVVVDLISWRYHFRILPLPFHDTKLLLGYPSTGQSDRAGLWLELQQKGAKQTG